MADESPKTMEEARWGLGFFILATLFLAFASALTLSWDGNYLSQFVRIPSAFGNFVPASVPLDGFPFAALGALQMFALGSAAYLLLFSGKTDSWEALGFSITLGLGLTGLIATVLALVQAFNLLALEVVSLGAIAGLVIAGRLWNGAFFRPVIRLWIPRRPYLRISGVLAVGWIGLVFALVVYQALFYPVVETDSLIYHAPLAAMAYYHGGLPWVVGGGVGLTSSANYPQLFSLLGATFYVWTGGVHDVYLRLLGAVGWVLTVYGTGLIGRRLGGKTLGLLAGLLAASVPSFISYGFLTTQMTILTAFGAFAFLAFVKSGGGHRNRWSILSGLFLGFAALTSYQGLYLIAPILVMAVLSLVRRITRSGTSAGRNPLGGGIAVLSAGLVGMAPYVRNWLLLGNPVYPFLRWVFPTAHVSPVSMDLAELHIRLAAWVLVGANPVDSSWFNFLLLSGTHPSFAPLNFLLTIPALLVLPLSPLRRRRELALCYSVVLLATLAGPIMFIRYFWLLIPFAGVIVAGFVRAAARALTAGFLTRGRSSASIRTARKLPVLVLASFFIMPVVVGFYGNTYFFGSRGDGTQDPFRYFSRPDPDVWRYLEASYGTDALAWEWLNANLAPGVRLATFEYRVYYLKPALTDPQSIFYLDSEEADPLYHLADPAEIASFLSDRRVGYIFVRPIDWGTDASAMMPLFGWLGSPYFPWAAVFGRSVVFHVGLQPYPDVPPGNPIGLSGIEGLTDPVEFLGKRVLRIVQDSNTPRVSVMSVIDPEVLVVRYWDSGVGRLNLNVKRVADNTWYGIDRSQKGNTSIWRTAVFPVPRIPGQSILEFGLHATGSDFIVDDIELKKISEPWFVAYGSDGNETFPSDTRPHAIFVYLPFLLAGQSLTASATAGGLNLSIDLFRGLIRPELRTEWWLDYASRTRNPSLPTLGTPKPGVDVTIVTSGTYTVVISLWSPWHAGITPDVQIAIR